MRVATRCLVALTVVSFAATSLAQSASPVLEPLTPNELAALRPLTATGVALLVREPEAGSRARVTVLVRSRAPAATVRGVIASPERYPEFTSSVSNVEILSRHQSHLAIRMHTSVSIFTVDTEVQMQMIGANRIDGVIVASQLGPGGFRWDLYPDGDATLIAYTAWADPAAGNWFLRQLARSDPAAIAGVEISYDVMLSLLIGRRAENLSGQHLPGMPAQGAADPGTIEPPAPGPWMDLARGRIVGAITLDASGSMTHSTVVAAIRGAPDAVSARLADVTQYRHYWPEMRTVDVQSTQGDTVRFHNRVDSTLFNTDGVVDRVIEHPANGARVLFRGVSGDYANDVQRWDVTPSPAGGSVVMLSGGSEMIRTGMVMRGLVSRVPWMLPGYSAALKMVWMRPLIDGL